MLLWKACAQTLHDNEPIPAFLSSLHVTESSWLQKRQLKVLFRGSLYENTLVLVCYVFLGLILTVIATVIAMATAMATAVRRS